MVAGCLWLGVAPRALASEPVPGSEGAPVTALGAGATRPWAVSVPLERQQAAAERFEEGNALLRDGLFVQASERYRDALGHWDHPGIHYNMALALLNLDQPLEVHAHLTAAMKYGPAPLDQTKFEQVQRYRTLVEKQLARIEVVCLDPGAVVKLDGNVLFRSPGRYAALVRPGTHTVTAAKLGFATTQRTKTLLPGEPTKFDLRLYTSDQLIEYRRPWPLWGPLTVVGAGAAILTTGVVLGVHAQRRFEDYDQRLERDPTCRTGCVPSDDVQDRKDEGETFQRWSTISYVAGGGVLAGGVVLLILNRSVPFRVDPGDRESAWSVSPTLHPSALGLSGSGRF